jgi:hypothetical protein
VYAPESAIQLYIPRLINRKLARQERAVKTLTSPEYS